ncbi:MAG: DUF1540 domain-containing protein [Candidatus Bathyarchaeota archaeon]|nr:MAG: DUF1540 domain-containing protein [Candidatus Bathyarchaeota archaeon]
MTEVTCERRDCKHWVDGVCATKKIKIKERTIPPDEEIAYCKTYVMVSGVC